jgi:hypothetical protein
VRRLFVLPLAATLVLASLAPSHATPEPSVPYPEGFSRWVHVSSGVIGPANPAYAHFGGMHHIYANAQAVRGYAAGRFEDGSIIVFDVHEALTAQDATVAGPRRLVDVMVKDSQRFASTGGWAFVEFPGQSKDPQSQQAAGACYQCHATAQKRDLVFSRLSD